MNVKRITSVFGILLMSLSSVFIVGCDKDDIPGDPSDAVTLNMLDENNGKTLLGTSEIYINKSNNFFSRQSDLIADAGATSGLGVAMAPKLDNLVREVAVTPGHSYQIFREGALFDFPSGARSIQVGASYYRMYVVAPIMKDNTTTGATVKYVLAYPDPKGLPEFNSNLGLLTNYGDQIEMALPRGSECFFQEHMGSGEDMAFIISITDRKIVVTLNKTPNQEIGPWGTYRIFVRLGSIHSIVTLDVR